MPSLFSSKSFWLALIAGAVIGTAYGANVPVLKLAKKLPGAAL